VDLLIWAGSTAPLGPITFQDAPASRARLSISHRIAAAPCFCRCNWGSAGLPRGQRAQHDACPINRPAASWNRAVASSSRVICLEAAA